MHKSAPLVKRWAEEWRNEANPTKRDVFRKSQHQQVGKSQKEGLIRKSKKHVQSIFFSARRVWGNDYKFTQLPEYHRGNKKKQTNRIVKMAEGQRVLPRGKIWI